MDAWLNSCNDFEVKVYSQLSIGKFDLHKVNLPHFLSSHYGVCCLCGKLVDPVDGPHDKFNCVSSVSLTSAGNNLHFDKRFVFIVLFTTCFDD